MKKKVLSYLLCAAMVLSMAACGGDSGTTDEAPADGQQTEEQQPADEQQPAEEQQPADEQQPAEEAPAEEAPAEEEPGEEEPAEEEPEVVPGPVAIRVESESFLEGKSEGVGVEDDHLGGLNTKAWAMYNVDLADGGYKQVSVRYGADSIGGTVRLWIGDEDYEEFGTMVGEAVFEGTGSWDMTNTVTFDVPDLSGQSGPTDLVMEWVSPEGESDYLMNPDYFELYKLPSAGARTDTWKFFDNDFSANEAAGFRGTEPDYTHIYIGAGCSVGYKLDFGEGGYNELSMIGDFVGACELELHLDAPDGDVVGTVSFEGGADWNDANIQTNYQTVSVPDVANLTGGHGIYFVVVSGDYNFAGFRFYNKPARKLSERIEAEDGIEGTYFANTDETSSGGGNVGGTQGNIYVTYRWDFEDGGYNKVLMRFGTITPGGTIEVRNDNPKGDVITTIALDAAAAPDSKPENFGTDWGAWADFELDVPDLAALTGEHIICFVYHPTDGDDNWVGNFDYYEFSKN